jgi:hypothetical protein
VYPYRRDCTQHPPAKSYVPERRAVYVSIPMRR